MDLSPSFPISCYIALAVAAVAAVYSFSLRNASIGLPMLVVVGTVAAWYFGDAFYNDYHEYVLNLGVDYLDQAWWQVSLFLIGFIIFAPFVHRWMNKKLLGEESNFLMLFHRGGLDRMDFQERVTAANGILTGAWLGLMFIALMRTNFDFLGMFAPYVAGKAQPWGRGRIGGGIDAFLSLANYLQIMLAACFGVVFALSKNPRTRMLAGIIWCLSAPWFFLDRTRNTMLAVLLPGLLTLVFLRLRVNLFMKIAVLGLCFLVVEGWMRFVLQTRSGADVAVVFQQVGVVGVTDRLRESQIKHAGLNMFEELAWANKLIEDGRYQMNTGARYFAELVNPIPRVLWPGKPLIGIDYAIARGQGWSGAAGKEGGVGATISTGMIGQGVVNFGPFFGVLAAAFLMAIWAALLARQDLKGDKTGRLLLYMLGLVLTFNLGRDITLITLYPFLFGYIMLTMWAQFKGER
jgi:hypothetical protein